MILTHRVTRSSIFSFFCLFLCLTLERSETGLFTAFLWRQMLIWTHAGSSVCMRLCEYSFTCVYLWRLVYRAQSPMSSIWRQPKRRAAITNEDRWQGAGATSCEHCNAYVRACLYAVWKYTRRSTVHALGWAPSSPDVPKHCRTLHSTYFVFFLCDSDSECLFRLTGTRDSITLNENLQPELHPTRATSHPNMQPRVQPPKGESVIACNWLLPPLISALQLTAQTLQLATAC